MAKIVNFSDNFALFLKLLDEKTASGEYETAISLIVSKLKETENTFFGELLKHRLSELYIPVNAYEENIALLAELAGRTGRSEYIAAIKMLYREMCVSDRRTGDPDGDRIDIEYLLANAVSGDMEELWDDYAFTFERDDNEPVRIDVATLNDLRNFAEAAERLASGDPEGAVGRTECIPDSSAIAELALSVKAEAAFDAGDPELAEKTAHKLYSINPLSRIAVSVLLGSAHAKGEFSAVFDELLADVRAAKSTVILVAMSRFAMLHGYREEAYAAAEEALKADKYYYEAIAMFALSATALDKREEGLAALYRGVRMFPRCNRLRAVRAVLEEYYNGEADMLVSAVAGAVPSVTRAIRSKLIDLGFRNVSGSGADDETVRRYIRRAIDFNCVEELEDALHGLFASTATDFSEELIMGISSPYVGYPNKAVLLYILLTDFSDGHHDFAVTSDKSAVYGSVEPYVPAATRYYNLARSVYALVTIQFIVNEGIPDAGTGIGKTVDEVFAKNVNMLNTEALCALVHYRYLLSAGLADTESADKEAIAAIYRIPVAALEKYIEAYA